MEEHDYGGCWHETPRRITVSTSRPREGNIITVTSIAITPTCLIYVLPIKVLPY